ncbi:hypothetical protein H4O20_06325 [Aequorivita sp. 609]|uniref:hypothetical protein n=1 Tax=Aequorivita TaxID=153265 RepID=UPI00161DA5FB|nr:MULTISPECIES: hypothetical protein [Aequorivita]MBB6681054.1 hypothetical protein [Aequorivita sp. 609]
MKIYFQKVGIFGLIFLFVLFYQNTIAQVGVGTTNPNTNAVLEVHSSPGAEGGLLLPSVALSSTDSFLPLSAHVAGMLVYNTVTAGSAPNIVTPGYYFNNGVNWVRIADASVPNDDWTLTGNNGLNATNNFIGTLDATNLRFRTSNTEAFEISSGNATNRGKLRAMTDGTAALPVYSWSSDTDTGIYRVGANSLGFSTNGNERVRVSSSGNMRIGSGANASEKLEVDGNLRINGAFMPGNQAGDAGRVLVSNGPGSTPVWGGSLGNVNQINRYATINGTTLNPGDVISITVNLTGLTTSASAFVNIQGNWTSPIYDDITIHNIEIRTNGVRFVVSNNTGFVIYPDMIFNITIIR